MDFARRQLEKYGWTDGKGLGKYENGISQALKPKLKRSVAGIGHDSASDFTEHWWETLYDKAATNIQVEYKNGKTKTIKTVDKSEFQITNNTWRLKKRKRMGDETQKEYQEYFIKTAILANDGVKLRKVKDSDSDEDNTGDVSKLSDEQLFAACGGRTAHKGARHGLKALGKLARIEEQEKLLLTLPKYDGYSHTKKTKKAKDESILSIEEKTIEDTSLTDENDTSTNIHKRKKKKYCKMLNLSENTETMVDVNELLNGQDIDSMKNEFVNKKSKKKRKKDKSRDNISK